MQGANYFSAGNVVVLLLDLNEYDEVFTNQIPGFYTKLSSLLPSLIEHHCSVGKRGGFFIRVKEGTLLGHVTEHVAIELQTMAGMNVGFGKTRRTTKKGVYNVVVRYLDEEAGIYAVKSAVKLINSILKDKLFDVKKVVNNLIRIRERRLFGPSTQSVIDEAKKRKIPYFRLDKYNLVQLGTGKYLKQIRATLTSDTNFIAVETADDKYLTNSILSDAGLPIPNTFIYNNQLNIPFEKFVIKPRFGNLGKGIAIKSKNEDIKYEIENASDYSSDVLIQEFINGHTYRILVIDYKFVAATRIDPPKIKGNGKDTIKELIEKLNEDPHRGIGDKTPLTEVKIDEETLYILKANNLGLDSILEKDRIISLKNSPNLKQGGTSIDVTDVIHKDNIFVAERAARFIGLNVAGVDLIVSDIRKSIFAENGAIIEVNAAPDFRMHLMPMAGKRRNPAVNLLNMLFPPQKPNHIPLIAVTGTQGKEKAVQIISDALKYFGYKVGRYAKNELEINGFKFTKQKPFAAVRSLLKDPTVDIAVVEVSLESILNDGLAYQFADFGIVLNVADSYENLDSYVYIRDLDDIAYAKSVVAEEVYDNGFTILNADDKFSYRMKKRIWSRPILFSKRYSDKIKNHINKGGRAVFIKQGKVVLHLSDKEFELDLPAFIKSSLEKDIFLASISVLYQLVSDIDKIDDFISKGLN